MYVYYVYICLYLYLPIYPSIYLEREEKERDHLQYYKNIEGQNFKFNLLNEIVFILEINYNLNAQLNMIIAIFK